MTRVRTGVLAVLLAAAVTAACQDQAPAAGLLTASLQTPNTDDGAMLVTVQGPGLANVQSSSSSYRIYWRLVSTGEVRVLIFGNLSGGPVFTAQTPGDAGAADYRATVVQVADRNDAERAAAGYTALVSVAH
ncbi:MAG: hypothetical protein ACREN5_16470 [Gemmatimonadales bacterium]